MNKFSGEPRRFRFLHKNLWRKIQYAVLCSDRLVTVWFRVLAGSFSLWNCVSAKCLLTHRWCEPILSLNCLMLRGVGTIFKLRAPPWTWVRKGHILTFKFLLGFRPLNFYNLPNVANFRHVFEKSAKIPLKLRGYLLPPRSQSWRSNCPLCPRCSYVYANAIFY